MRTLKLLTVGLAVLASNSVLAATECTENCVTKLVTDFSGRPPFKRKIEVLSVVDIAEVEIVTSEPVWVDVKTVNFTGKPPFKRKVERLQQTDIMQVEIAPDDESSEKRPKKSTGNSIFKRH